MFNKMKNILTFGLYNRLVEAESTLWTLADSYSELKRRADGLESDIENLDIDGAVEEEINKRDILTHGHFDPSDYDIVTSNDYDFDSFVSTNDYDFDDFMTRSDVEDECKLTIEEATDGLVHEDDIHNVIENKIDDGFKTAIDNSADRIINDNILELAIRFEDNIRKITTELEQKKQDRIIIKGK